MSKLEQTLKSLYSTRQQLSLGGMILFVLCTCALPAHAQVLYGSLTGNVTDASGAVVSGAKVTVLVHPVFLEWRKPAR
jgi:hypothetical protein